MSIFVKSNYLKKTYCIHFVGIGGIGMSGIAEILFRKGIQVKGSDILENTNVQRLKKLGIEINIQHDKKNIIGASVVVISSAISTENVEVLEAKRLMIPVIKRVEMLQEIIKEKLCIAVSGTHGKTTTTSMISSILDDADFSPTIISGGIINKYNTNAIVGNGEWIVVEADESDASFLKISSIINVVTNIDREHMDYYVTEENLENAFFEFVNKVPFYGVSVLCIDHPLVKKIAENSNRRIITYGINNFDAMFRAEEIRYIESGILFNVVIKNEITETECEKQIIKDVKINMFGRHNVLNALAAFAVSFEVGIIKEVIVDAFNKFLGVERRFTIIGKTKNEATIVDDYAHHPVEILAIINSARHATKGNVIVLFQPHRYSRFKTFYDDFLHALSFADSVIVLPVYAAGEKIEEGLTNHQFARDLKNIQTKRNVYSANELTEILKILNEISRKNDFIMCLGAGSITEIAKEIHNKLK